MRPVINGAGLWYWLVYNARLTNGAGLIHGAGLINGKEPWGQLINGARAATTLTS